MARNKLVRQACVFCGAQGIMSAHLRLHGTGGTACCLHVCFLKCSCALKRARQFVWQQVGAAYLAFVPILNFLAVARYQCFILASQILQDLPEIWSRAGIDLHTHVPSRLFPQAIHFLETERRSDARWLLKDNREEQSVGLSTALPARAVCRLRL